MSFKLLGIDVEQSKRRSLSININEYDLAI